MKTSTKRCTDRNVDLPCHPKRVPMKFGRLQILAFIFFLACPSLLAQESVLMKALRDELGRTMEKLQLEDMERPYFVAYWVQETNSLRIEASLGGLLGNRKASNRYLSVQLRVGDHSFDNTNFLDTAGFRSRVIRAGGPIYLPLEDDYGELRRQIWLATDGAYKQAVQRLARKRAVLQNKTRVEEVGDFSQEEPVEFRDSRPAVKLAEPAQVEAAVKELSSLFKEAPHVFASNVRAELLNTTTYFVNSEGSSYIKSEPSVSIRVLAETQASDGAELADFVVAYGRSWEDLPRRAELEKKIREMATHLGRLRDAETVDLYSGPVLFEGQAAAELVNQGLGPKLLAQRTPMLDDPRREQFFQLARNPFQDKLGARVLPRFLSVVDNPTAATFGEIPLLGGYQVDEEGVRSRETTVIQRGILKTLLTTRNPVRGIPKSTGHRRNMGPSPSNLFVQARNAMSGDEIKQELLSLVQERGLDYGIIVRRMGNPNLKLSRNRRAPLMMRGAMREPQVEPAILAYKLLPDGREELIQKVVLSGFSESSFRDIVAASDVPMKYDTEYQRRARGFSMLFDFSAGGSFGTPLVSLVTPSLLFEDLTLKRPTEAIPRPPVIPPPARGQ